jgi:hypothetical protein
MNVLPSYVKIVVLTLLIKLLFWIRLNSHALYYRWNLYCTARDLFVFKCHRLYSGASSIKGECRLSWTSIVVVMAFEWRSSLDSTSPPDISSRCILGDAR